MLKRVTALGPATVANVCAGFDVLGFALEGLGDRVTLERIDGVGRLEIASITGRVTDLPRDPERNTATVALASLMRAEGPACGFRVSLDKGIPLGSGMGGSAASAVAAVVAANRFLDRPLSHDALLLHAVQGEAAASGAPHADNAAPCLYGGLTATVDPAPKIVCIPVPAGLRWVLVHPQLEIETRAARAVLPRDIPLGLHVEQSMRLAGFLAGCFGNDPQLVGRSMVDLVAEPWRKAAIPGFEAARRAAQAAGALGFGIAGSGPSLFAWTLSDDARQPIADGIGAALRRAGLEFESWCGEIARAGARVTDASEEG